MVTEQDNVMSALRDKLMKKNEEVQEWKSNHDRALRQAESEQNR